MDERLTSVDNVVFDIGGVLLDFSPEKIFSRLIPGENGRKLLAALFGEEKRWRRFDLGAEPNAAIAREAANAAGLPSYACDVERVLKGFPDQMTRLPMSYTFPELRRLGKKIYLLTNYPSPSFEATVARFPFLLDADGYVVSAHEKVMKPDPAIFRLLLDRCDLKPERSLFLDDSLENVESAASLGFQTWHYAEKDGIFQNFSCLGNKNGLGNV